VGTTGASSNNGSVPTDLKVIEEREVARWTELARQMPAVVPGEWWSGAGPLGRAELLEKAHREMRPAFSLHDPTRVVFAKEVEEGDEAPEGMGFDDEHGEYIVIAFATLLDHEKPGVAIAGLAHELRHAFQFESIWGPSTDPRVDEWRSCYRSIWRKSESGALETDARRAQETVAAALGIDPI
jgi:hypothetical protein